MNKLCLNKFAFQGVGINLLLGFVLYVCVTIVVYGN